MPRSVLRGHSTGCRVRRGTMQLRPHSKGFWVFRILVLGGIARIVLATGCIGVDPGQEADLLEESDGIVVADTTTTLAPPQLVVDLSARWLPESLVPFRLPLESSGQRHLPSPWPTRPEVIESVLSKPNWEGVRPSVVALYKAVGFKPVFLGSPAGRKQALALYAWLVASAELGMDPNQLGVIRLLEMTGDVCKVEAAGQLGSVAHDPTLQLFVPTASPSAFVLKCADQWVTPERELDLDVRLVAGFFVAWQHLAVPGQQSPIRWEGPDSALKTLLEMLPKDALFWRRVAALRAWTHPALAWSSDTKGKWVPLKPGVAGPRVEELNRRLFEMGYLAAMPTGRAARTFAAQTVAAVRSFRESHGLAAKDGVDASMVELLALGRERRALLVWDSLNRSLGRGEWHFPAYVMANLADQRLWWVEQGNPEATYRIAVGKAETGRKPSELEWMATVTGIVLNPEWYPTYTEWKRDILPQTKKNRSYLGQHGFEKRGNRWVQLSGERNVLGKAALSFTEQTASAVHGAPVGEPFDRAVRNYTSGDIRVDGLEELAVRWRQSGRIPGESDPTALLESGTPRALALSEGIPFFAAFDRIRIDTQQRVAVTADPDKGGLPQKQAVKGFRALLRRVGP